MQATLQIFKTTVKEYAAYRLNFILWRLRMFLNLVFNFFLWSAVYYHKSYFGAYQKDVMISYILYANLIAMFIMGSRTAEIGGYINDGTIINLILKPISFFKYYFARDLADKMMNIVFAIGELLLVILLFQAKLIIPQNIGLFVLFFINAVFISFFINLMLSFIAFWTPEVWAPRFLFTMLVFFVSGSYFPLNLLPSTIYHLLLLTPFPYLFYLPTQIIIGHIEKTVLLQFIISYMWVIILYIVCKKMWTVGNKSFSFYGR